MLGRGSDIFISTLEGIRKRKIEFSQLNASCGTSKSCVGVSYVLEEKSTARLSDNGDLPTTQAPTVAGGLFKCSVFNTSENRPGTVRVISTDDSNMTLFFDAAWRETVFHQKKDTFLI